MSPAGTPPAATARAPAPHAGVSSGPHAALPVAAPHPAAPLPAGAPHAAALPGLSYLNRGKPLGTLPRAAILALAPAQTLRVHEPHANTERSYRVVPLRPILNRLFGDKWRQADVVVFGCVDGYQAVVPVPKLASQEPALAFASGDGTPFRLQNDAQHENVALGPWYLVWKDSAEVRSDGGADWPYQVVSLELDSLARRFPKLGPPEHASASARRGFALFQRQCIACHTINGEGGGKAPELNYPVNVTEYFRADWLKRWISAPRSVRFSTNMPALDATLPHRDAQINDLVAYLRAMRERKLAPAKAGPAR